MTSFLLLQSTFWISAMYAAAFPFGHEILATSSNCSADSKPCGPVPSCCKPGLICNFRRGIPICTTGTDQVISGFDHYPCGDPYLFRCDVILGLSGYCCPIGTSCRALRSDNIIRCIDALGTTTLALPSATTAPVPSATPVTDIHYSPSDAWRTSDTDLNCTRSKSLHMTDIINATISVNFTGPSIMVHTVTSSMGGVFSVWADGVDTDTTIDTFFTQGNQKFPLCYPLQFPPFMVTPPGFEMHSNHTLTLIYTGPSKFARNATVISTVQFDSFATPNLQSRFASSSSDTLIGLADIQIYVLFVYIYLAVYLIL